jgi:hypothetical protein
MTIKIGDKIKVIYQDIIGYVVKVYDSSVVIEDEYAETEDNTLEFRLSDVQELEVTR